eukprot:scaffold185797_cov40-Attheya_sp.AAC.1
MAEPTALRLHDNQSFPDQLGYAVHQTEVQTMVHLKAWSLCHCKRHCGRSTVLSIKVAGSVMGHGALIFWLYEVKWLALAMYSGFVQFQHSLWYHF